MVRCSELPNAIKRLPKPWIQAFLVPKPCPTIKGILSNISDTTENATEAWWQNTTLFFVNSSGGFAVPVPHYGFSIMTTNPVPGSGSKPWPTEIKLGKDRTVLTVAFDTGDRFEFPAELLRVLSPSAEVQGHSIAERQTVAGKKNVAILEVHPIGNYAVRLVFDDLHSTGIYSWDYFLGLGQHMDEYWRDYVDALASKGLSREPVRRT